jgi:uncharacterized membrane protein YsdA (DUF1294 family)/cold shock CspA family protein
VRFDPDRGFGFVRVEGQARDVFVHVRDILGNEALRVGQMVSFEQVEGDRGPRAQKVVPGRKQLAPELVGSLAGLAMALSVTAALVLGLGWPRLHSWILATNLGAFALYGWDKRRAQSGQFRLPEISLHLMAAVGGSIGALAGQRLFRHKTRKVWFQAIFWATVALQLGLVVLYVGSS